MSLPARRYWPGVGAGMGARDGFDGPLTLAALVLLAMGLLIATSASMPVGDELRGDALYYFKRQGLHLALGLVLGLGAAHLPLRHWQAMAWPLLGVAVVLLILVLIPGIGTEVKGSYRWLRLGPLGGQPSELVRLLVLVFVASYCTRRRDELQSHWWGFAKPLMVLSTVMLLLLMEPDFGAAAVLFGAVVGVVFLAGARLAHLLTLLVLGLGFLASMVALAGYRVERIASYLDPWSDPFHNGYQLTQALIAYGRGGWLGLGPGNSIQKLLYLPDAHTDFVFAVFTEEMGILGGVALTLGIMFVVLRGLQLSRRAERQRLFFHAYLGYGIALLIGIQTFVNIGVATGLLPTKGLTLPMISYGGSNLVVTCIMLGVLLRLDLETRALPAGPGRGSP